MLSHQGAFVMVTLLVQVNDPAIQGPDEGDDQDGVMWRDALQLGVLSHFNVSIGRCQGDLCGLWRETRDGTSDDEKEIRSAA